MQLIPPVLHLLWSDLYDESLDPTLYRKSNKGFRVLQLNSGYTLVRRHRHKQQKTVYRLYDEDILLHREVYHWE